MAPEGRRVRGEAPRRRMTPRNTGSRRTGTTPQPNFPATDTRGPASSTVKPTPTSWNADDSHRTFRPMRRRHHSAWASPSLRKHTSASGAQSRVSAAAYAKGWGRALLGLTFDLPIRHCGGRLTAKSALSGCYLGGQSGLEEPPGERATRQQCARGPGLPQPPEAGIPRRGGA